MKKTVDMILYIWQLPQNLLGWVLMRVMAPGTLYRQDGVRILRSARMRGGISLGRYIIVSDRMYHPDLVQHEWGHCRQSRLLGPLYLPLIGLPSLLWAAWWRPARSRSYFSFFTERWADKLAGINRH